MSTPAPTTEGAKTPPTADEKMNPKEKAALIDQMEEFEGPDRQEKRGTKRDQANEPGVANS